MGDFILLNTALLGQDIDVPDAPIDDNPCLACKLCVAACPVGAIKRVGAFDFQACFTHSDRAFMGGFTDRVEQIADSQDALDCRRRDIGTTLSFEDASSSRASLFEVQTSIFRGASGWQAKAIDDRWRL